MLWDLILGRAAGLDGEPVPDFVLVGGQQVPLKLVRNARARRYLLRLLPNGTAQVTIPNRGNAKEARSFAELQTPWLEHQLRRWGERPPARDEWVVGGQIFFRGELVEIASAAPGWIRLGTESLAVGTATTPRLALQKYLQRLAARELPARVLELAQLHGVSVARVSVRNQRSRWGSCSRRGTISLNWRLVQLPPSVRDYIILHELMHRRQLNHSAKFWHEVALVCPDYETAERWLKKHAALLTN